MKIPRRAFVNSCLTLFLATTLHTSQAQTTTVTLSVKQTIVIVHGAWGGSWAFRKVEALLREKGFNVYRPQLTGLGERVHLARHRVVYPHRLRGLHDSLRRPPRHHLDGP